MQNFDPNRDPKQQSPFESRSYYKRRERERSRRKPKNSTRDDAIDHNRSNKHSSNANAPQPKMILMHREASEQHQSQQSQPDLEGRPESKDDLKIECSTSQSAGKPRQQTSVDMDLNLQSERHIDDSAQSSGQFANTSDGSATKQVEEQQTPSQSSSQPMPTSIPSHQPASQITYESLFEKYEFCEREARKIITLISASSWMFKEQSSFNDILSEIPNPAPGFQVIGAIGKQAVGKSRLLNQLAGAPVFCTHFHHRSDRKSNNAPSASSTAQSTNHDQSSTAATPSESDGDELLLKHVTRGVNLHITRERVWLIDTMPVLSASVLDEFLCDGHSYIPGTLHDGESFLYITSLQLVAFMLANCDHLIIVNDWILDTHLLKLIATAQMLVGESTAHQRAELIFYFPHQDTAIGEQSVDQLTVQLQAALGKCTVIYDQDVTEAEQHHIQNIFNLGKAGGASKATSAKSKGSTKERRSQGSIAQEHFADQNLVKNIFRLCARRKAQLPDERRTNHTEKNWITNAQHFWSSCTAKNSIFIDYGRFLPKIAYDRQDVTGRPLSTYSSKELHMSILRDMN